MRLNAEMFEDVRGSRSVRTTVYLHGPIAWPDGPLASWSASPPEIPVDQESKLPGAATRTLANLDVIAPDDLDAEQVEAQMAELREELSSSPGTWVERERVGGRYLVAERAAADRDAVLRDLLQEARARLRRRKQWTPLRVLRVELSDFRRIDRLTLAPSANPSTVLVGANGSGKTTLLDAMVLLLSHFEGGIRGSAERPRELADDDIMNGLDATTISITMQVGTNPVTWSLSHTRGGGIPPARERAGLFSLDDEVAALRGELARGNVCLPIALYYPVNRAVLDIPMRIRTTHPFEPLEAYDGALAHGTSNFRLFFEWFRAREDLENETRIRRSDHRDHELEAVRRAIASLLPGVSDLRVQRSPLRMVVTKGEWTLYVDQLSDGEKCLLAMAGDLARRLAIANPFADDPLHGGGVVLIDELELHLHPGWQRRIVPSLERTFPNCQFIVSTHSPAVLGHVDHDSVFILNAEATGVRVARPDVSKGMDVNRILEDLLDVPARPEEFEKRLEEMYRRMDAGDTTGARAIHAELVATLKADDPALVKADVLLRRREARRP
jgi:predicted ATP-binding protein involved in virulence